MDKLTYAYVGDIVKLNKDDNGNLIVTGSVADDSLDLDKQVCDPEWLNKAVPEWFETGGNIREQHDPKRSVGKATEYAPEGTKHPIVAKVVDPIAITKAEEGLFTGFSVGIKGARVVKDDAAPNGRIVDGKIIEVSLVDRPANPNCQLVLAKAAGDDVVKAEDFLQKGAEPTSLATIVKTADALSADLKKYYGDIDLPGSFEGQIDAVRQALYAYAHALGDDCYAWPVATFSDRVVACVSDAAGEEEYYEFSYTVSGDEVTLGQPTEVDLTTTVTPAKPDAEDMNEQNADTADKTANKTAEKTDKGANDDMLSQLRAVVDEAISPLKDQIETLAPLKEQVEELRESTKAVAAVQERLAEVEKRATPDGPARVAPVNTVDKAAAIRTARHYEQLASQTADATLRQGYIELAKEAREQAA